MSALDLGSQENEQSKDVTSDRSALSDWTSSQILNILIFKILPIWASLQKSLKAKDYLNV